MNVSDYIVDYLSENGISHGFFMIGGSIGFLADACARKGFTVYTMHHEQSAAFAAEAQAALTRKPGLAMATSGPGATNLVTGIGSAFFGSLPVLYLTGQVNTFESDLHGKRRQVGFQETDIVSIVKPITKYAVTVNDPKDIAYELEKAVFISMNERMGPVLLDLPLDVQKAEITEGKLRHFIGSEEHKGLEREKGLDGAAIEKAAKAIMDAERPIVLVGNGVRLSNAEKALMELIEKTGVPAVTTLMGTDSIPHSNKLLYGFIGTYGNRYSNFALANADLILVLGARLDSRQVGVKAKRFAPMAKIIHVDIDDAELGASVDEWLSVRADIRDFLEGIVPLLERKRIDEWLSFLDWLRTRFSKEKQDIEEMEIDPVEAVRMLSERAGEGDAVAVDVGSNQMWFGQGWKAKKGQCILTNGGMAPMGYALPAAIGASISQHARETWAVTGDGGLQINIQELQTAVRHKLPVKIMVLNNNALGMLTQFQTENFGGRLIGSVQGYDAPDFVKVARAYGLAAERAEKRDELEERLDWLKAEKGPALLDLKIPVKFWALPKSRYSRPVHDMMPFLEADDYRKALRYVDERAISEENRV